MKTRSAYLSLIVAAALAGGCGGGSGTSDPVLAPTSTPIETVTFAINVPGPASALRRRNATTVSAQSVTISLDTVPLPPPATPQPASPTLIIDLGSGSAGCTNTSNGLVCTGSTTAPAGQQEFTVSTYSLPGGQGALLSTGSITERVGTSATTLNLSYSTLPLNSIVASMSLAINPAQLSVGANQSVSVNLNAYDATGAIIIGSGSFAQGPIQVHIPGANVYFPKTDLVATFNGPGPAQTLQYQSTGLFTNPSGGPLVFTAQGENLPNATATLTFLPATPPPVTTPTPGASLTPVPSSGPTSGASVCPTPVAQFGVTPSTIDFAGVAPQASQSFTAQETGVASFSATSLDNSIATVTGTGTTFTVTAGSTAGSTNIVVTDPSHNEATVCVNVKSQVIIIQSKPVKHE